MLSSRIYRSLVTILVVGACSSAAAIIQSAAPRPAPETEDSPVDQQQQNAAVAALLLEARGAGTAAPGRRRPALSLETPQKGSAARMASPFAP